MGPKVRAYGGTLPILLQKRIEFDQGEGPTPCVCLCVTRQLTEEAVAADPYKVP